MAYPLLLTVSLTGKVRGGVGEEGVKEEGVEVVVGMERPSIPRCAFVALCHHP